MKIQCTKYLKAAVMPTVCFLLMTHTNANCRTLPINSHYDDEANDSTELLEDETDSIISENDKPWPYNIKERISKLLDNDMFETSTVGICVYDLTADSAIFLHNEKQLMRPASTMKMIVAVAALDKLGYDHEYNTRLAFTGEKDGKVLNGDIWCKGDFDPAFKQRNLEEFVDSIKSLDVDTINGKLIADMSMKDELLLGEGWCWDDDNPILSPLLISEKNNFMEQLERILENAGITITGGTETGKMPCDTTSLCTITRTINDILPRMMKKSDNLYAETIFYHLAASASHSRPATAKAGRQMINRMISDFGLKPSKYYIADGSGLSLYNYVSPQLEVEFLKYAYRKTPVYTHLYESMPVAGIDGTLKKRMRNGYARGNVRAKTGTVTGVSALAGYCTAANGHVICFSIINMGIRHSSSGRRFQDRVCEALCRP